MPDTLDDILREAQPRQYVDQCVTSPVWESSNGICVNVDACMHA